MLVFEKKDLERLRFVVQTGGRNPKVKFELSGIESMVFGTFMFNRNYRLTPAGRCLVFGEDDTYRGYIKLVNGLPKKFKPDPIDEGTKFSDWYTVAD